MAVGTRRLEPNQIAIYYKEGEEDGFVLIHQSPKWRTLSSILERIDELLGHRFCNSSLLHWVETKAYRTETRVQVPASPEVINTFRETFGWPKFDDWDDDDD